MAQKVKKKIIQVLLFLSRLLRVYVSPSSRFYDFRWHTRGPFEENLWSDTRGLYLLGMVSLGLCHAFGYLWINTQILVVLLVMLDLFVIHVKVRRERGEVAVLSGSIGCHGDIFLVLIDLV